MNIYWFERSLDFVFENVSEDLESAGFSGILFPFSAYGDDAFVSIARNIKPDKKIKYMVAVRPYTISPQYLNKIAKSINKISNGRILVNFVTGWVYDDEKSVGGVHGKINDSSPSIERSNYLIEYIKTVNEMKDLCFDFYVSVTNSIVFEKTKNNKVIIPYSLYKEGRFNLSGVTAMISLCPVIRKTKQEIDDLNLNSNTQDLVFFTEKEFEAFLKEAKSQGIDGLLIFEEINNTEKNKIIKLMGDLVQNNSISNEDVR
jgi:hypothetical protein